MCVFSRMFEQRWWTTTIGVNSLHWCDCWGKVSCWETPSLAVRKEFLKTKSEAITKLLLVKRSIHIGDVWHCLTSSLMSGSDFASVWRQCPVYPCKTSGLAGFMGILGKPTFLGHFLLNFSSGWWFGRFIVFHSVGDSNPNWRSHIFRGVGWNHQPVIFCWKWPYIDPTNSVMWCFCVSKIGHRWPVTLCRTAMVVWSVPL